MVEAANYLGLFSQFNSIYTYHHRFPKGENYRERENPETQSN